MPEAGSEKYRILFTGEIETGQDLQTVKDRLGEIFKTPPERIEKLFSGRPVTLNHNLSRAAAEEFAAEVKTTGAVCHIEPMEETFTLRTNPGTPAPKTRPAAAAPHPPSVQKTSFQGKKNGAPDHASLRDQLRLFASMAGAAALCFLYIVLIVVVADLTIVHIDENSTLLDLSPFLLGFLLYVLPLIFGIGLFGFMFKPLFARPLKKTFSVPLSRKREPALYLFVEKLCQSIGAPLPSSIEVDTTTQSSITFGRHFFDILEDNLILTFGLPLVSDATLSEFAFILAHEFAPFKPKMGKRFSFILLRINGWFVRAANDEDSFDQKLADWSLAAGSPFLKPIFLLAHFFSWVVRQIFQLLAMAARSISKPSLRQVELDADRHAGLCAGTENAEEWITGRYVLAEASAQAFSQLSKQRKPNDNALPNNFVQLISALAQRLTGEEKDQIKQRAFAGAAAVRSAKPGDQERIEFLKSVVYAGTFQSDKPAASLFSNFDELGKAASLRLYRDILQIRVADNALVPVSEILDAPMPSAEETSSEPDFFA